ncbi:MAG: DNA repair protein RecO [Gammaproteobacteria bacterium]|nr:DNA repair protein RecO [Gammaproteobacteria bacterium]
MMSDDGTLSPAFILHVRKFRDTSVIIELLTEQEGRISAVMRGVRTRKSKTASFVRPFTQVLVSWFGRSELKTVKTMDFPVRAASLSGDTLMLGMYVNELLVRLLGKFDPVPDIFSAYGELLDRLERGDTVVAALRHFELVLLAALGYGITFDIEAGTGQPVSSEALYRYAPDEGFHRLDEGIAEPSARQVFRGDVLLAISEGRLSDPEVDRSARQVIRSSLGILLGGRDLKSRELFRRVEDLT